MSALLQLEVQPPRRQASPSLRKSSPSQFFDEAEKQLDRLIALLAAIAADGQVGPVDEERREALRDSGLLAASIPAVFGGLELPEARIAAMTRRIAEVDIPLARVFAVHHSQIAMLLRYADPLQQEYMLGRTVSDNGIWGSAVNSLDMRLCASPQPGGYLLGGQKGFCAGAVGSDYLLVSAYLPDGNMSICIAVASLQLGVSIRPEFPGSDTGRVSFEGVKVAREAVIRVPAEIPLYAS